MKKKRIRWTQRLQDEHTPGLAKNRTLENAKLALQVSKGQQETSVPERMRKGEKGLSPATIDR